MGRRFLTAEDVRRLGGPAISVDADTVVTPQALEAAASLGIRFARWEDLDAAGLREFLTAPSPALIDLPMTGTRTPFTARIGGRARAIIEPRLGDRIGTSIRRHLGGG